MPIYKDMIRFFLFIVTTKFPLTFFFPPIGQAALGFRWRQGAFLVYFLSSSSRRLFFFVFFLVFFSLYRFFFKFLSLSVLDLRLAPLCMLVGRWLVIVIRFDYPIDGSNRIDFRCVFDITDLRWIGNGSEFY